MAIKLPSNIEVGGRFPLDDKYWVQTFANLNDGEIYEGLHRWIKTGQFAGKEFVLQQNGVWKEAAGGEQGKAATIQVGNVVSGNTAVVTNRGTDNATILDFTLPKGPKGDIPIIDIGDVIIGTGASVINVGTLERAILNFTIPQGKSGLNGVNGQSVWIAYADDINGTNSTFNPLNKKYISFVQSVQQPLLSGFTLWSLIKSNDGQSVWIAYSPFSTGANASYTLNTTHKYISILTKSTQPLLNEFNTWVLFKGENGGADGLSAYQSWLQLGNVGTEEEFLESLKGSNGASAYQIWLALGNVGSEQDFLEYLQRNDTSVQIFAFPPKTVTSNGIQIISLPITTTGVFSIFIKEPSGYTRLTTSYTYENGTLTITEIANLLIGDILYIYYKTNQAGDPEEGVIIGPPIPSVITLTPTPNF